MKQVKRKAAIPVKSNSLKREYDDLMRTLIESSRDAEEEAKRTGRPADPDVTKAVAILNQNPKLVSYLNTIRERAEAKAAALGESVPFSRYAVPGTSGFLPDITRASPTGSHPQDQGYAAWGAQQNQPIGVGNSRLLREWADTNEWVRAAINIRRIQVGRADIMVVPADASKPYNKKVMKEVQLLLDQPNELRDSYRSLIEPVIEDILVLDRGVISKNMTAKRQPTALYAEDGATIKIYPAWSGKENEPRYLFVEPNGTRKVPLRNDEAIVIMANPATYRYGRSPVEVLQNTIRADLKATQSAMTMVDMKPPPHAIQIPGISQTALDKMKQAYEMDVMGRKELLFLGGPQAAHVFPLVFSAKDNQWLEWQEYLAKKIGIIFQISPQQFGFTMQINRSTSETQQEIFEDTGLIPLLLLLEEYLNRELLADFAGNAGDWRKDLDTLNLRIIYPEVSEASRQMHSEKSLDMAVKGLAGMPSMTLNQVLDMRGDPRVEGGNTFWMPIGQSVIPVASYDNDLGVYADVMIGQQDASGGPAVMDPPKPKNEQTGARRVPEPQDAGQKDPGDAETNGNGPAPAFNDAEKGYRPDRRAPGKNWSPRHIRSTR